MSPTILYAVLTACLYLVISLLVFRQRRYSIYDFQYSYEESVSYRRLLRTRGEHGEVAPLMVILLYLIEQSGASLQVTHILGAGFVISRLFRIGYSIHDESPIWLRYAAAVLMYAVIALSVITLILKA